MVRTVWCCCALLMIAACSPRGFMQHAAPAESASVRSVWVANFRSTQPAPEDQTAPPRPDQMTFQHHDISIPEGHQLGHIEWPKGPADATTDFVTLQTQDHPSLKAWAADVAASDTENTKETLLYVHGYNVTHGEAVYQLAQLGHDFEIQTPVVAFSWPSAGVAAGYVYDRDSAFYARDQLEQVILALTRGSNRKLVILGHSMGNLMIMEALRQIEISGKLDINTSIEALFMVSPDIDGELFHAQASRLKSLPDPWVIVAAKQDRALRLSAILTGKTNRLGSATDRSAVRDLPISVIDVSELANGGFNHSVALTSPAAISILKNLTGEIGQLAPVVVLNNTDVRAGGRLAVAPN
ncbi:MAG: alpha/beta fold hydrolase [Thalassovita sp.]